MTPQAQLWTILPKALKEWAGMSLFIFLPFPKLRAEKAVLSFTGPSTEIILMKLNSCFPHFLKNEFSKN
jgi:hypothetical protein